MEVKTNLKVVNLVLVIKIENTQINNLYFALRTKKNKRFEASAQN